MYVLGGEGFVGRTREVAELERVLAATRAGRGGVVLVGGPAGVGKTSLVRKVVAGVREPVLWSAAWDAGGAPPFWIWVQVLRRLVEHFGAERVRVAAPGDGAALAPLLPEVFPAPAAAAGGPAARFAIFDAVVRTLRALTREEVLVLVLEDLHAADGDALALLEFLAHQTGDTALAVLGTLRDDDPVGDDRAATIARLRERTGLLALGGLPESDVAQILDESFAAEDRARLARRLHRTTDGNPLFVTECLRMLAAETGGDRAIATGPAVSLPDAVHGAVRRRLADLPPGLREVLEHASVLGREFGADTLAALAGRPPADVLAALDDGALAHLVRPRPRRPGRFAFTHAVIREALHDGLPAARRAELHAATAAWLTDRPSPAPAGVLAYHWYEAAPVAGAARAIAACRRAGDEALALLAFETAEEHYENALDVLGRHGAGAAPRRELLHLLGDARMRAGHVTGARRALRAAFDLARGAGDHARAAGAALSAAPWGYALAIDDAELVAMLGEAVALPLEDPGLRGRLLAADAVAGYWTRPAAERQEAAAAAIAAARAGGDPRALARVLADAHLATWDADSPVRSAPWLDELAALVERTGDRELALVADSWRISMLVQRGEVAEAGAAMAAFARGAASSGQPRARAYALRHQGLRAVLEGRGEDVERLLGELAAAGDGEETVDAMLVMGQAFVLRWTQGRLAELEPAMRHFAQAFPLMPVWRCALALVLAEDGRGEELARASSALAADEFAGVRRDNLWLVALTMLTEACAVLGDAAAARVLSALLTPYAGQVAVLTDVVVFGPVHVGLARLALVTGDADAALRHVAAAREQALAAAAGPLLARLDVDEARALLLRAGPGDAAAAGARLARAAAAEAALGLAPRSAAIAAGGPGPRDAAGPRAEAAAAGAAVAATLERRGRRWHVVHAGRESVVPDSKGLQHLARLLALPGVEVHALDLAAPAGASAGPAPGDPGDGLDGMDHGGGLGPALDAVAKAAYRSRLADLDEELEEARGFRDPERVAGLEAERAALLGELRAAVGLGGRDRPVGAAGERARVNVTRALRTAIRRLAEEDPDLGRHLEATIRTGTFCVHRADLGPVSWTVRP